MGYTLAMGVRSTEDGAMPWPIQSMNDIRREFVRRALAAEANLAQLCREYGISRKTGYKWRTRAMDEGLNGIREHSRRPQSSPTKLDEQTVCRVVQLKLAHPRWGPKKLRVLYSRIYGGAPSVSACHRVLRQIGLVAARKRRVRTLHGGVRPAQRVAAAPNDEWTADFKGWWQLASGQRCEPLTVRDAYSRFVLAAVLPVHSRYPTIKEIFIGLFQRYGLPRVIRTDNGSPFASAYAPLGLSRLSSWWVSLGIDLARGRPGHPQDNGAHERMHGDIAAEIALHVQVDRQTQQAALDLWREEYNHVRPHESLDDHTPAQIYRRSERRYAEAQLEYGPGFFVRKVLVTGKLCWDGVGIFISTALAGHNVGLRRTSGTMVEVWLYHLLLGSFDSQTYAFQPAPSRGQERARLSA